MLPPVHEKFPDNASDPGPFIVPELSVNVPVLTAGPRFSVPPLIEIPLAGVTVALESSVSVPVGTLMLLVDSVLVLPNDVVPPPCV